MTDERQLSARQTAWIRGATDAKIGQAILTNERLIFFDQKFIAGAVGGVVGAAIADRLQKRHEAGGPILELSLAAVIRIERQKKLLNKDRILLATADAEYLFNDGWKDWSPLLREALADEHGRRIVDDGPDRWRVEPA